MINCISLIDDHSRVTLKPDGNPGSDYINASFIGVRKFSEKNNFYFMIDIYCIFSS